MDTEKYVQRENLALSKKRLPEAHSDAGGTAFEVACG